MVLFERHIIIRNHKILKYNKINQFGKFKKIDAHTHIGAFGSPFNIDFNTERLLEQMAEYNIEKTVLCSASAY